MVVSMEGGAFFGRHYVGGELWVGEQLPSLRIVFRESFGDEARTRRRRAAAPTHPDDPDRAAPSVVTR